MNNLFSCYSLLIVTSVVVLPYLIKTRDFLEVNKKMEILQVYKTRRFPQKKTFKNFHGLSDRRYSMWIHTAFELLQVIACNVSVHYKGRLSSRGTGQEKSSISISFHEDNLSFCMSYPTGGPWRSVDISQAIYTETCVSNLRRSRDHCGR